MLNRTSAGRSVVFAETSRLLGALAASGRFAAPDAGGSWYAVRASATALFQLEVGTGPGAAGRATLAELGVSVGSVPSAFDESLSPPWRGPLLWTSERQLEGDPAACAARTAVGEWVHQYRTARGWTPQLMAASPIFADTATRSVACQRLERLESGTLTQGTILDLVMACAMDPDLVSAFGDEVELAGRIVHESVASISAGPLAGQHYEQRLAPVVERLRQLRGDPADAPSVPERTAADVGKDGATSSSRPGAEGRDQSGRERPRGSFGELRVVRALAHVRIADLEPSALLRSELSRIGVETVGDLAAVSRREFRDQGESARRAYAELRLRLARASDPAAAPPGGGGNRANPALRGVVEGDNETRKRPEPSVGSAAPNGQSPTRDDRDPDSPDGEEASPPSEVSLPTPEDVEDRQPEGSCAETVVVDATVSHPIDKQVGPFEDGAVAPALPRAAIAESGERGALDTVARFERAVDGLDAGIRQQLTARPPDELSTSGTDAGSLEPLLDHLRGDQVFLTELEELTARMAPVFDPNVFDAMVVGVFPGLRVCSPASDGLFRGALQRFLAPTRPWRAGWAAPEDLISLLDGAYEGEVDGWSRDRFRQHIRHTDSSQVPFSGILKVLGLVESNGIVRSRTLRPKGEHERTGGPLRPSREAQPRRPCPDRSDSNQKSRREAPPTPSDGSAEDRQARPPTTDDVARILGL